MKKLKGVLMAGGHGTRLYPLTSSISKQLLPIYSKPMIYYPLSVLMLAGIREILIVTNEEQIQNFINLLGDGRNFGVSIEYKAQKEPKGIADGLVLAEDFLGKSNVCLILGDNFFYGGGLPSMLRSAAEIQVGAQIFTYRVSDPSKFGIVELDDFGKILSVKEKPKFPASDLAVTGLYFLDDTAVQRAHLLEPSERCELEITSIIEQYLKEGTLKLQKLGRGHTWLDAGSFGNLFKASQFVQMIEERQGLKVACLEEISLNNGWISEETIYKRILEYKNSDYGRYLSKLLP